MKQDRPQSNSPIGELPWNEIDLSGFEQLFRLHYAPLVRFAYSFLKDQVLAEDLVQEVFTRLWQKKDQLQIRGSVRSYLFTSVRNHCLNQLSDKQRKIRIHQEIMHGKPLAQEEVEQILSFQELQEKVNQAIAALPPRCREVFVLRRWEEKSYKEIAKALDISEKTVENQISKALKLLREALKEHLNASTIFIGLHLIEIFL